MKKFLCGHAVEPIPYGATILLRGGRAARADGSLANAIARTPDWCQRIHGHYEPGDGLIAEPIAGIGMRDLQALADGPIMDPLTLFLPAGKLSQAEYQERLRLDFARAGIEAE